MLAVSERFSACLRPADTVARLGGDEFTVLLEDVSDSIEAERVAERITAVLDEPFYLGAGSQGLFVTTSIGIAFGGATEGQSESVLRNADLAMYKAKSKGKSHYEVFESGMDSRALERLEMENGLRQALQREEFRVYYQPSVSLSDGGIVGMEALLRWDRPERGIVPPAEFIPLAEETGLIVPIGQWVLREACCQTREWQERFPGAPSPTVSVNLSAKQFRQPGLAGDVAQILRETGLGAHSLILEITESVMMDDAQSTVATLRSLKLLGVRIAVDDFGTGYSSLSYLKRFPVDFLKIDRSFVDGLGHDTEDQGLVAATIGLAHTLGLETVAEGVETEGQLAYLRKLDCGLAQGHYFQRPAPAGEISEVLQARLSACPDR